MPKKIDPTTISVSGKIEGVSPSEILKTQINRERDAYNASQISNYSSIPDKFFDEDLESNLKDLTGALPKRPPTLGEGETTFSNGTLNGITDWGVLKQYDSDIITRRTSGSVKVAGNGVQVRKFKNQGSVAYPYFLNVLPNGEESTGDDIHTDPVFNVQDDNFFFGDALPGGGEGASHLATKFYNNDLKACRVIPYDSFNNFGYNDGFTISGFLFPADRGTVALLHWDADQNDFLTPAPDRDTIMSRVIGAINLGQGIESGNDGKAGGEIFIEGNTDSPDKSEFPSRLGGQYDLSEMQRAIYRSDDPTRAGNAIPNLSSNAHLGSVRLLRNEVAFDTVHPSGNLPVLFGTEYWNFDTNSYENYNALTEPNKNFLSYRMPYLSSYDPSDLEIPKVERARFFKAINPASTDIFNTAGNYFGFESDAYTYQIARYRYTVTYKQIKAGLESTHFSMTQQNTPNVELGSFALVHFRTEEAFEKLVRDGIAPSEDDLWSYTLYDYNEAGGERNMVKPIGDLDEKGILKSNTEEWENRLSNNLVKPSVVITGHEAKYNSLEYISRLMYTGGYDTNNFYSTTKFGYNQRYVTISGVTYNLPVTQRYYDTSFLNFDSATETSKCSFIFSYNVDDTSPEIDANGNKVFWSTPFYSFKNQQGDSVVRQSNYGTTGIITRDQFHTFSFAPYSVSTKDLSSSNRVGFESSNSSLYVRLRNNPENGLVQIDYDSLISQQFSYNPLTPTSPMDFYLYYHAPIGDTKTDNPPVFSDDLKHTTYAHNPIKHRDGTSIEEVLSEKVILTNNFLYHSAYCKSLLTNASTSLINVAVRYADSATRSNHELAFILYRIERSRLVAQELTLLNGELEKCTGLANPSGGNYEPTLPIYRVTNANGYTNANTDATFSFTGVLNSPTKDNSLFRGLTHTDPLGNNYTKINLFDSYVIEFINESTLPNATLFEINIDNFGMYAGWTDVTSTPASGSLPYGFDLKSDGSVENFNNDIGVNGPFTTYSAYEFLNYRPYAIEISPNDDDKDISEYGNFLETENGVIHTITEGINIDNLNSTYTALRPYMGGFTARKDVQERFLDEMYRIDTTFTGFDDVAYNYNNANYTEQQILLSYGDIRGTGYDFSHLSVRDDAGSFVSYNPLTLRTDFPHKGAGWIRHGRMIEDLSQYNEIGEAQVKPLPYSNDGHPLRTKISISRGMLTVPSQDYSGYTPLFRPGAFDGFVQPDYSSGNSVIYNPQSNTDLYYFTRLFDLRFSRAGAFGGAENLNYYNEEKKFKIRIVGLHLEDLNQQIEFSNLNADHLPITVMVMVPGVTGWLNVAKANEDGSLKTGQANYDAWLNGTGVGCRVSHEDNVIVSEAVRCVDITCDISPLNFFQNNDGEMPLLVRVVIQKSTAWDFYKFENFSDFLPQLERKGIIGVEVLRLSNGKNFDEDEVLPYSDY